MQKQLKRLRCRLDFGGFTGFQNGIKCHKNVLCSSFTKPGPDRHLEDEFLNFASLHIARCELEVLTHAVCNRIGPGFPGLLVVVAVPALRVVLSSRIDRFGSLGT